MKWVTRERPKIDRIACPWLVRRFLDSSPEFLFVPADQVLAVAERDNALPFDVPGVEDEVNQVSSASACWPADVAPPCASS